MGRGLAEESGHRTRSSPRDDDGAPILESQRRGQALIERRKSVSRMLFVGAITWPSFVLVDLFVSYSFEHGAHLGYVLVLRGAGTLFAIAAYLTASRTDLGNRGLDVLDMGAFACGSVLLSLMCVPFGGIGSPLIQGVSLLISMRAALVPTPWRRVLPGLFAIAAGFPLTMGAVASFDPETARGWHDPKTLALFATNMAFVTALVVLGAVVSQTLWSSRKQISEARRLGNYRLKMRLSTGAMGEVWLAKQESLDRYVALKMLKGWAADDPGAIRRFEREARSASRLRHPNTIRIYDFGATEDGVVYLAMELLDGVDLDELVTMTGPLSPARAIHLARQACRSLAEAHEAGIIHRDIKPANLFVAHVAGEHDVIKLLDFGVACFAQKIGQDSETRSGVFSGSPAFMAPEVADNNAVDARSDLYSLGAVLFFMLTGEMLFPDKTVGETILLQIGTMPDTPSARLGHQLSADLEQIVMRCLAKSPADRFQSADDLEAALARCKDADRWTQTEAQVAWMGARSSMKLQVERVAV